MGLKRDVESCCGRPRGLRCRAHRVVPERRVDPRNGGWVDGAHRSSSFAVRPSALVLCLGALLTDWRIRFSLENVCLEINSTRL